MQLNEITGIIIKECIKIHQELGPGLFESVYQEVLSHRLVKAGFQVKKQFPIPVIFDGVRLDAGFRADLLVEGAVIVEIKSIEALAPVHHKQLLTYLKLSGVKVGLLINFNVDLLKNGIKRMVNNFTSSAPPAPSA